MKFWKKSKLEIYQLDDMADVIATSEAEGFDDDLTPEDDWL